MFLLIEFCLTAVAIAAAVVFPKLGANWFARWGATGWLPSPQAQTQRCGGWAGGPPASCRTAADFFDFCTRRFMTSSVICWRQTRSPSVGRQSAAPNVDSLRNVPSYLAPHLCLDVLPRAGIVSCRRKGGRGPSILGSVVKRRTDVRGYLLGFAGMAADGLGSSRRHHCRDATCGLQLLG